MAAITWKNVGWDGPPIGAAAIGSKDGGMFSSLKESIKDNIESEEKQATSSIYQKLAGLSDPDTYAKDAVAIMGGAPRQADMEKLAAFQQGRKTALLNQEAQRFDNEHAGEELQARLASSRAYSRVTNNQQDTADKLRSDLAKMQKITNSVKRNEDGSINRPAVNKLATEANIPSATSDKGIDQANATAGFDDILAARTEALKHKREMEKKRAGSSGGKGGVGDVYTGYEDSNWFGWGQGQDDVNELVADLKLNGWTKNEISYVLANSTVKRGLTTVGPKEHSSVMAENAKLEVLKRRITSPGK